MPLLRILVWVAGSEVDGFDCSFRLIAIGPTCDIFESTDH